MTDWGLLRRVVSRGGSAYARLVLGVPVRDLTGGFKCFRRAVLEALDLDRVHANGYGFQIELTYRAVRAGFSVEEVPIVFRDRRVGESKMTPESRWRRSGRFPPSASGRNVRDAVDGPAGRGVAIFCIVTCRPQATD